MSAKSAKFLIFIISWSAMSPYAYAKDSNAAGAEATLPSQNAVLSANTNAKGYGPQSPRDLASKNGSNKRIFSSAPDYQNLNLCNIHMHKNAEHKWSEFAEFAGPGDGHGNETGYKYSGKLSPAELKPLAQQVCKGDHGALSVGDTIEVHYVYSSAQVKPGPTLGACLSDTLSNPQLRVEAQVYVLVNDPSALNFDALAKTGELNGYYQALNIPKNAGIPVEYAGSTTGPTYNEIGSPFQVSWSVFPRVLKVNAESVGKWCNGNEFKEDHAHGVRNLVKDPELLSKIKE
jgi:hypothetical protein